MFGADILTFREFAMHEPLPLSTVQNAVLEFLRGRDDAVLFGAQAVNAYVDEPRMSQDLDLQSARAAELAEELREYLHRRFHIAVRTREVGGGRGYRLYQTRQEGSRHLVYVRAVSRLPAARRIAGILVMEPASLIASKAVAHEKRRGQPKSGTDWRYLAMLLLAFPELKRDPGPVSEILEASGAAPEAVEFWRELVVEEICNAAEDDDL
jgi:hypothetical protein